MTNKNAPQSDTSTRQYIFQGVSFVGPAVSKEEYSRHYEEYLKRVSGTTTTNKILRDFSEVKSIKVQVGNQYLLLEDSPSFIRNISPNVNYLVKYQDGTTIQSIGNKVREYVNGKWQNLN